MHLHDLQIKVNGYTFRGSNFTIFQFCLSFKMGSAFKGKNLFLKEQILSLTSTPQAKSFRGADLKSRKFLPFVIIAEKL